MGPMFGSHLRKLYAAYHVFVLPSLADLAPRVVVAATSSGKPVVATNVGCIPSLVEDSRSGFLVDPANERQPAERIRYLIGTPARAKQMGAYGRALAENRFSSSKIADKLESDFYLSDWRTENMVVGYGILVPMLGTEGRDWHG